MASQSKSERGYGIGEINHTRSAVTALIFPTLLNVIRSGECPYTLAEMLSPDQMTVVYQARSSYVSRTEEGSPVDLRGLAGVHSLRQFSEYFHEQTGMEVFSAPQKAQTNEAA